MQRGPLSILAVFIAKVTKNEYRKHDASFKVASCCEKIVNYKIAETQV
jgi:hypothetical protein